MFRRLLKRHDRAGARLLNLNRGSIVAMDRAYNTGGHPIDRPDDKAKAAAKSRAIRTGWGLWFRALPAIARDVLPVAAVTSMVFCASGLSGAMHGTASRAPAVWLGWVLAIALVYGIALVGAILSEVYTDSIQANPYLWTARRLVPWAATWTLHIIITYAGLILLVVPGLVLGVRLFWADEYAGGWSIPKRASAVVHCASLREASPSMRPPASRRRMAGGVRPVVIVAVGRSGRVRS